MDNIPEFDDAESLFVNWKDDDNSGCSNNNAVAGAGAGGGPSSLSKETSHLSSNDWNDILDAADKQPSNGASSAEDSSSKTRSNKDSSNKVSASSSENTTSSATANTAITSDVKSKSNDNNGGNSSNSCSGNSLQFSIEGCDETTTNFGDSSLSSSNNNNFTFPMYYQMNQGHHIHPLAMTSMASCPPYNVNASSEAAQNTTVESAGLQSLMQQQHQQAAIQPAADQQMQTLINNSTSTTTANSGGGNNASTTLYNSPYADHLRELTANFRNNPSTTTSMNASQAHYGMAVNGFHPQVNAQVNHVLPLSGNYGGMIGNSGVAVTLPTSSATSATTTNQAAKTLTAAESSGTIKTSNKKSKGGVSSGRKRNASATTVTMNAAIDQHTRNSRERNEREQVRAQKITQLISELRVNMQQGGWQEEMKSKYQTLSQCKEYVDFLVRSNKKKLADIEHTKKLVKEKFFLEARSGHLSDSVTSSLTAFTTPSSDSSEGKSSTSSDCQEQKDRKKRKINKKETEKGGGTAATTTTTTDNKKKIHDENHEQSSKKEERRSSRRRKRKLEEAQQEQQQQVTTNTDSSSDYDDDESPGGKNIAFDKTSSSVSDMTDSNKSCTTNNNTKSSTGSISSTAAVVRGLGSSQNTPSRRRHRQLSSSLRNGGEEDGKSDAVRDKNEDTEAGATRAVVKNADTAVEPSPKKKKKKQSFGYDFREVFLKSNVPQLIATLSGRIVVWNDFFLHATGLNKQDIGRLTIFSIVQSNQLSALYKMVARALAEQHVTANSSGPSESTPASESESHVAKGSRTEKAISQKPNEGRRDNKGVEDWQVITLRCVPFPSSKNEEKERPLFLTITLMGDANLDQRCFHCTLTDAPSDEGQVGTVTPEFLVKMFSPAITAGAGKGT